MYALAPATLSIIIDRQLALSQLRSLGYQNGDMVYLRGFFPDGDPRKHTDKGRKLESRFPQLPWQQLEQLQAEDRGIYFVVNGGGQKDEDVAAGKVLFYEHDDLAKEISRDLWQQLGLPEPTLQVDTGGKSIHSYWVLSEPCTVSKWRTLQTDLLEFAQGDRKLKNPSRVMRLAGAFHIKPGREPIPSQIITQSGQRYSFELLRSIVPTQKQPETHTQIRWHEFEANFQLPIPETIPLIECLTRSDRDLIERGSGEGERNSNGFKLAANLITTADYLSSIGQRYDSDPQVLFGQYSDRCHPPLEPGEQNQIWKSATQRASGTSLAPDQIEACIKGWAWRQLKTGTPLQAISGGHQPHSKPRQTNTTTTPLYRPTLPLEQVINQIRQQLTQPSALAQLQAQKIELRAQTNLGEREFNILWDSVAQELELNLDDQASELHQLIRISDRRLSLDQVLHPHLAHPLDQLAHWMGVDPEALLTLLIPTAASLLNPESRVIVKNCSGFSEPFIFYTGVVTPSGNKKSPMLKAITSPLSDFQEKVNQRYDQELAQYESALRTTTQGSEPPQRPKPPREYFVDNITGEALDQIKAQQPRHGLLLRKDELSGLFGGFNAYRGGKGSDREGILSGWSGGGVKVNRKSGTRLSVKQDATSIAGAIQPGKLREMMGNFEDEQGDWARFLWYQASVKAHRLPEGDTSYSVGDLLTSLYQRLDQLPAQQYRFSREAQALYEHWHYQMELQRVAEPRQGMSAAIAKMQGYCARLAGILHVLWSLSAQPEEPVSSIISIQQVQAAIELSEFYLGQVQLIHAAGTAEHGGLTEILQQILVKAKQWGAATARNLISTIRGLRKKTAQEVRMLFHQLQALGYGAVEGTGTRIKFVPASADTADKVLTQVLTDPVMDEIYINQEVQAFDLKSADTADAVISIQMKGVDLQYQPEDDSGGDPPGDPEAVVVGLVEVDDVSSVSSNPEIQELQAVEGADTVSAVMSALTVDLLNVGDAVVVREEADADLCQVLWSVQRIEEDQVVLMDEQGLQRCFPRCWVTKI